MMKDTKNINNKYSFDRYELERNFDIEMEDETFKKLVSKLKLSKDELIKCLEIYQKRDRRFGGLKNE